MARFSRSSLVAPSSTSGSQPSVSIDTWRADAIPAWSKS